MAIDPQVIPQHSEVDRLTKALPELLRVQPTGVYREVMLSKKCTQREFVKAFGNLIAAPPETERLRKEALRAALSVPTPLYFEDTQGWGSAVSVEKREPWVAAVGADC